MLLFPLSQCTNLIDRFNKASLIKQPQPITLDNAEIFCEIINAESIALISFYLVLMVDKRDSKCQKFSAKLFCSRLDITFIFYSRRLYASALKIVFSREIARICRERLSEHQATFIQNDRQIFSQYEILSVRETSFR